MAKPLLLRLLVGYFRLLGWQLYDRRKVLQAGRRRQWLPVANYGKNLALFAGSLYGYTVLIGSIMNPEHHFSMARYTGNMVGLFSDLVFVTVVPAISLITVCYLFVAGHRLVRLLAAPAVTAVYRRYPPIVHWAWFGAILALHFILFVSFFHEVIQTILADRHRTGWTGAMFRLYLVYMHFWYLHLFLLVTHFFKHATLTALADKDQSSAETLVPRIAVWMRLNRRFNRLIAIPSFIYLVSTATIQTLCWFLVFSAYRFDDSIVYSFLVNAYALYVAGLDERIQCRLRRLVDRCKEINLKRLAATGTAPIIGPNLILVIPRQEFTQHVRFQELIAVYGYHFNTQIFLTIPFSIRLLAAIFSFILSYVVLIIQTNPNVISHLPDTMVYCESTN